MNEIKDERHRLVQYSVYRHSMVFEHQEEV